MRWDLQFPASWLLLTGLCQFGSAIVAADEPQPVSKGDRMAAIVAAVRAEEAKYRDIEYVARIVIRDTSRKDPAEPADVTTMATRRLVLQGDRIYFRHQAFERMPGIKARRELVSAYDGERTRTVTSGNCANIHLGRFLHPEVTPAHSLPLAHYKLNFPLSVYLSGTLTIHAYLKYPRELIESGSMDVFARVATHFEGEEKIDGLRCLKLRIDRWFNLNLDPITQYLWLAPERNYHCVQEKFSDHDMHVEDLREVAPGVWFPTKITASDYVIEGLHGGKKVVAKRTETLVEKVDLAPHYAAAFFRDVAIPADLPVFTIKDRALVGSKLPDPVGGDRPQVSLLRVAAQVAREENRYDDIEVKVHVQAHRVIPNLFQWNPLAEESWEDRSIVKGDLAYHITRRMQASGTGWDLALHQVDAFDGRWSRRYWSADHPNNPQGAGVLLRRGRVTIDDGRGDGIFVYRPHTLLLRDDLIFSPLADLLASPRHNGVGQTTLQFRPGGTAEVDGHPCLVVRGAFTSARGEVSDAATVLYLAADRNHIPIKLEACAGNYANPLMPTRTGHCEDFREIAPGLWYPVRVTELGLEVGSHMGQGWLLLNWRRDTTIDSVTLAPRVDEAIFRDVIVPAGANVQVQDEAGQAVGEVQQADAGIPSITPERYQELVTQMKAHVAKQQAHP